MHAAFRNEDIVIIALEESIKKIVDTDFFRLRYGIFVQADCCLKDNPSKYSIIPTFTCNFCALTNAEAEGKMNTIMDLLYQTDLTGTLRKNFLRVRCEAQLFVKFNLDTGEMNNLYDIPQNFPKKVKDLEYYDAHIHILGLTAENILKDWPFIASVGAELDMPIIINKLKVDNKQLIKPFLTKRWYNSTLDESIISLGQIYKKLLGSSISVPLIPEFEVTLNDPDCQVTDQGWMPTPFCVFKLTKEHCIIPKVILDSIEGKN